ncbi:uncharacterized protein [Palaemon carinicauda]|uniref:uncharacterized protein n=1 Tax=Palaemon carinicauda TaxID=392227 RepID=UPI0035B618DB
MLNSQRMQNIFAKITGNFPKIGCGGNKIPQLAGSQKEMTFVQYPRPGMGLREKDLFVARSTQTHVCPGCMNLLRNEKWHGMCTCSKYQYIEPPVTRSGMDARSHQALVHGKPESLWTTTPKSYETQTSSGMRWNPSMSAGPPGQATTEEPPDSTVSDSLSRQEEKLAKDSLLRMLFAVVVVMAVKIWKLTTDVILPHFVEMLRSLLTFGMNQALLAAFLVYVRAPSVILNVIVETDRGEYRKRVTIQ